MRVSQLAGYSGPDRRKPVSLPSIRPQLVRLVVAAVAVLALWCALGSVTWLRHPQAGQGVTEFSRAVAGSLLLVAAMLRLTTWRLTGLARAAWAAIGLAVAGIAFPVIGTIDLLLGAPGADTAAIARGLVELTLVGIAIAALASPDVVARLRPVRIAGFLMAGCLSMVVAAALHGAPADPGAWMQVDAATARWATAAMWSAVAVAFVLLGCRRHRPVDIRTGLALGSIAAAEVIRAGTGDWGLTDLLIPAGVQVCAAFLVAGVSALRLWQAQTGRGTKLLDTTSRLHGVQSDLTAAERDQARRLHDARSALLTIWGAARLMASPEEDGNMDRNRLHSMLSQELHRLGSLLDPQYRSSARPFRPADLVEPLVLAHRLAGGHIDLATTDALAMGCAESTTTAVASLLCNARQHAPGAHVWVTIEAGEWVTIDIADDGPGIDGPSQPLALQPGVRGPGAVGPGSGIGLAAAAQIMSDQGGTLTLGRRAGGGTVVRLTLPRATVTAVVPIAPTAPVPPAAPVPQHAAAPEGAGDVHRERALATHDMADAGLP